MRRRPGVPQGQRALAPRELDLLRGEQLVQFVTVLDKHINNTSVVLLLEFGGFRMLFPGDAEVAAWQEIVSDTKVASALKGVDLYRRRALGLVRLGQAAAITAPALVVA